MAIENDIDDWLDDIAALAYAEGLGLDDENTPSEGWQKAQDNIKQKIIEGVAKYGGSMKAEGFSESIGRIESCGKCGRNRIKH